jgi:Cyclic nucleotide-binding domain
MGEAGVGVLTAALGAGAVASSLGASTVVSGRRLAVIEGLGVMLCGLPLTLSGALPYAPIVLGLMCVVGVGNSLVDIGLYTLPARLVPEQLLARVFGVKAGLTALSAALGALAAPLAIDLVEIRGALLVVGLLAPLVVALTWRRLHAIDATIADRDREIDLLSNVPSLRLLPMPAIDSLAMHAACVEVTAGEEVIRQGDVGDRFYVIENGETEVIGDGRLVRTLGSGDAFGEIALRLNTPRTATVRARTPLRVHTIGRRAFHSAVSDYESCRRETDALVLDRLSAFAARGLALDPPTRR